MFVGPESVHVLKRHVFCDGSSVKICTTTLFRKGFHLHSTKHIGFLMSCFGGGSKDTKEQDGNLPMREKTSAMVADLPIIHAALITLLPCLIQATLWKTGGSHT